jgi:hypothetical protein
MVNKPELMVEREAAAYIAMSVAFLRQGRCHGIVGNRTPTPAFFKNGRSVRYSRADLDRWLADRRVEPGVGRKGRRGRRAAA